MILTISQKDRYDNNHNNNIVFFIIFKQSMHNIKSNIIFFYTFLIKIVKKFSKNYYI